MLNTLKVYATLKSGVVASFSYDLGRTSGEDAAESLKNMLLSSENVTIHDKFNSKLFTLRSSEVAFLLVEY